MKTKSYIKSFMLWIVGSFIAVTALTAIAQIDRHGLNINEWTVIDDVSALKLKVAALDIFSDEKKIDTPAWHTWSFELENHGRMKFLPSTVEVIADIKFKLGDGARYINTEAIPLDTNKRDKSKWTLVLLTEVQGNSGMSMHERAQYDKSVRLDTRWMCHIKDQLGDKLNVWKLRMNKAFGNKDQFHYPSMLYRKDIQEGKKDCFDKYLTLTKFSKSYSIEKAYMGWLGNGDHKDRYSQTIPSAVLIDPEGNIRKRFGFGTAVMPSHWMIVGIAPHIGIELPKNLDDIGIANKYIGAYPYEMDEFLRTIEVLSGLPDFALGAIAENLETME